MAVNSLRSEVLSLYKRVLRFGRIWTASNPSATTEEKEYIIYEARYWFRRNRTISDPRIIKDHIQEAEARLEMGKMFSPPGKALSNFSHSSTLQKSISKACELAT